ncbi:heavy metal-binding domain-containing protein [Siphonobacter aquaeclarae]|uniref:Putative heavy-metal-binding n=1 Tax=Siphonobacter aquaeclarae TaxID=563176 RepID=A0A1G9S3T3_9BACT|nr:heavy metal-binding domain-containing protein [Siphonobacter aquaeclarae]MBO9637768.1 heavy metal-binding domain-containing protein [Siphonobacter aquaeclarae]SDM30064.1 Putative heavy-metal-binding [Siphonobacter aquaeclarae]
MKNTLRWLGVMWVMQACFTPSVPITTKVKYDLPVYWNDTAPDRPYDEIRKLTFSDEKPLVAGQTARGRMTARGNDATQKDKITQKLVEEAKDIGADAVIKVKYQYYTSATANGFTMEGIAIRYRGQ